MPSDAKGLTGPKVGHEEFELLIDAVQDYAIFLLSPTGEIRSWNAGARRLMGYEASEAVGRHFSMFYPPEDLEKKKPEYELETAEREGRVEDEGWRLKKDGGRFWANTVITALRDRDGTLHGFAKVTRDMTLRRQAEEELRQSAEIFELLVSSVRDYAIFMLDPEGYVETWNVGAERIKGYRPEEIIGQHFSAFYTEEDRKAGKPEQNLATVRARGSVEDEGWRVRKDGSRFWANVVLTAVYDAHGTLRGFAKVTRDITDQKESEEMQRVLYEQREARLVAEEERRRAEASYRVAQEANRAKDEFLMTLSHELRTPMTSILGWSRMLPTMQPGDPMIGEAIDAIARSAKLQARLIDDILDVSRVVSGKLRLTPENLEVTRMIMNAVDSVSPAANAKGITITTSLAPGLGSIVADATRIQQVIWNLLTNALKFTPQNGAVQVIAKRTASHLQISVKDNGEGIAPSFLPHVFEPFRQAESPHTRAHGGLGLGLSIVRYIAEAHGGTISAESEGRGKGATFTIMLPVRAVETDVAPIHSVATDGFVHRDRLRNLKVMLVEDDHDSRLMVASVLRSAGANVLPVESARIALDAIELREPDIVITDIAMPEMDGYALARALRLRDGSDGMKIVALSAFPQRSDEDTDFDAFLSKPVDPFHLIEEIARIVVRPS